MNMQKNKKIVLTGGHGATTAYALIEELKKDKTWQIHWIGSQKAIEGKSVVSLEFNVFPSLGVICHHIHTGRLHRKFTKQAIISLFKLPIGFLQSLKLILTIRPNIIISFGGFAGFPVVLAGWIFRVPIIIHEQTSVIGLANKMSIPFANKIALARPESLKYFPSKKSVVIGNPMVANILDVKSKNKIGNPPTIFITCGSRGSQIINNVIETSLIKILNKYKVIHQTGSPDYQKFLNLKNSLEKNLQKNYQVHESIDPRKMANFYEEADFIIARAGANTVWEIINVARPAILIPIPWTRYDEQTKNAEIAVKANIALLLNQNDLNESSLIAYTNKLTKLKNTKPNKDPDQSAASKLADLAQNLQRQ
jgi:UDP-N-acetylglucosamine--N-acetylmuramyl-(pentapeptide) pyrophosphoryl-undecaprenol N-acetylglucosamine transferase